jgi:glycosyltransferase involved in cell wall biosynthesis
MSKPAVTVVIPSHNMADRLNTLVPAWASYLEQSSRPFEVIVVDDGSTDATGEVLAKLTQRYRTVKAQRHAEKLGFGASLRTALAQTHTPLFFYTSLDYPYMPSDLRPLLERIELKDEILHKQPDLISGCRTGLTPPTFMRWGALAWKIFCRIVAGLPISEPTAWHGWSEWWFSTRVQWVFGVPLADVNSCFKLFRTDFLRSFPIQSDGDFVHTELAAKATFLTSIMDEVPLTPKPDPIPPLGPVSADRRRLFSNPEFRYPPPQPPSPPQPSSAVGTEPAPTPT